MKHLLFLGTGIILFMGSFLFPDCQSVSGTLPVSSGDTIMPIIIQGDEQSRLDIDIFMMAVCRRCQVFIISSC